MLRTVLMIVTALGFMLLVGCSDDDPVQPGEGPIIGPDPPSLMAAFVAAYEGRDLETYRSLLHDDFQFVLQQDTVDEYGLPLVYFVYAEEVAIHASLFSGDPITTPNGTIPGISSITLTTFERQGVWAAAPAGHTYFPGEQFATYNVRIEFRRPGGTTLLVMGFVQIYVSNTGSEESPDYKLLGMVDLTSGKQTEDSSWGDVRALYR